MCGCKLNVRQSIIKIHPIEIPLQISCQTWGYLNLIQIQNKFIGVGIQINNNKIVFKSKMGKLNNLKQIYPIQITFQYT